MGDMILDYISRYFLKDISPQSSSNSYIWKLLSEIKIGD